MFPVVCRPWHYMGGESFAAAACDHSSACFLSSTCVQTVFKLHYTCMQARRAAHDPQLAHTYHIWHVQKHSVCRHVYAVLMTVHYPCKSLCAYDFEVYEAICHSPWVICMLHTIAPHTAPEHVCVHACVPLCL